MAVNESLRAELLRRRETDQARDEWLRESVGPDGHTGRLSPERAAQWQRIDEDNASWLRRIIDAHGWPGRALVGDDGAHAAWLLAIHAPDPHLQRECLRLLGDSVRTGQAAEADWATLLDRVLLNEGRAQVFGTQLATKDRAYLVNELHDEDSVDVLRSRVGLPPVRDYLEDMAREHPPDLIMGGFVRP